MSDDEPKPLTEEELESFRHNVEAEPVEADYYRRILATIDADRKQIGLLEDDCLRLLTERNEARANASAPIYINSVLAKSDAGPITETRWCGHCQDHTEQRSVSPDDYMGPECLRCIEALDVDTSKDRRIAHLETYKESWERLRDAAFAYAGIDQAGCELGPMYALGKLLDRIDELEKAGARKVHEVVLILSKERKDARVAELEAIIDDARQPYGLDFAAALTKRDARIAELEAERDRLEKLTGVVRHTPTDPTKNAWYRQEERVVAALAERDELRARVAEAEALRGEVERLKRESTWQLHATVCGERDAARAEVDRLQKLIDRAIAKIDEVKKDDPDLANVANMLRGVVPGFLVGLESDDKDVCTHPEKDLTWSAERGMTCLCGARLTPPMTADDAAERGPS